MAKNRTYTGSRQSVGTPTLGRNDYFTLIRQIRKAREQSAKAKTTSSEVSEAPGLVKEPWA